MSRSSGWKTGFSAALSIDAARWLVDHPGQASYEKLYPLFKNMERTSDIRPPNRLSSGTPRLKRFRTSPCLRYANGYPV